MIVVVFLLALMPLALLVMAMSQEWQRGAVRFRDLSSCEYAAESGIAEGKQRLAAKRMRLAPNESTRFELSVDDRLVRVRADRLPDEVLSLSGELLSSLQRTQADLEAIGVSGSRRQVYQFRKIDVYLLTAEVRLGAAEAFRAFGVFVRDPEGRVYRVGTRTERVFLAPSE